MSLDEQQHPRDELLASTVYDAVPEHPNQNSKHCRVYEQPVEEVSKVLVEQHVRTNAERLQDACSPCGMVDTPSIMLSSVDVAEKK